MKVAIVHDWFIDEGGAERVIEELLTIYPEADLFSLFNFSKKFKSKTSFLQNIPFVEKFYRYLLPLFPFAIEQFDLSEYDLVISSSSCVSKGVITAPFAKHLCYCHTPMRYCWDLHSFAHSFLSRFFLHKLRLWDVVSSLRVDHFIANSEFVAARIKKYYRRESTLIHPPVDTDFFALEEEKEDYFVTVSRLVPYKRVDLLVEAFEKMPEKKLFVIGSGPEKMRHPKNVIFLGSLPREEIRKYVQKAKAFLFAGIEDFGIAPLEAQSSGTAVIAFARGGLKETITEKTGLFFHEQTSEAIVSAIQKFEKIKISPVACRKNALRFSKEKFRERWNESADSCWRRGEEIVADVAVSLPKTISQIRRRKVTSTNDS